MTEDTTLLCIAAVSIGFIHTILGPDHYLPFIAMSRAGGWSLSRTMVITLLCGIGHVLSSAVLGLVGVASGLAIFQLESIERFRGDVAGWLLLAFGFAYFIWGVRRAVRNKPHTHWHAHANGTSHVHEHRHAKQHVHVHADSSRAPSLSPAGPSAATMTVCGTSPPPQASEAERSATGSGKSVTPWVLFTIFFFGPCEPLIPMLMYPAAKGEMMDVLVVVLVFGVTTLATMAGAVLLAHLTVSRVVLPGLSRYGHALAGVVVLLCGAAIKAGL